MLEFFDADRTVVFLVSALAMAPLASLMGQATKHLARHMGAGIGSLNQASLGNAAELIIALVALHQGLHDVVKASLTGSILGHILLGLGAARTAGGFRHRQQRFNCTATRMSASLVLPFGHWPGRAGALYFSTSIRVRLKSGS
jgi:Ca2+:H+ antiporter